MEANKLRRQIAFLAAQMMYSHQETEYFRAKQKAARRVVKGWVKPRDLPSNSEIRDEVLKLAFLHEGDQQRENLSEMRFAALAMMQKLERFRPRLIGSVLTGHVRKGSDIDLHVFSDSVECVCSLLETNGLRVDVQRKLVTKNGESNTYVHIHMHDRYPFELTVYPSSKLNYGFKSSITGKLIERATLPELRQLMQEWYPDLRIDEKLEELETQPNHSDLIYALMLPLENVKQHPKYHPEGDALYHSLQVFDLACDCLPYDEEFLLAALLHDVGKAIDPRDHVNAGLDAIQDFVSDRTYWLVEHHMDVHRIRDRTIGARQHRRLRENENYDELIMLGECDFQGRKPGVEASELEEAIEYLQNLDSMY